MVQSIGTSINASSPAGAVNFVLAEMIETHHHPFSGGCCGFNPIHDRLRTVGSRNETAQIPLIGNGEWITIRDVHHTPLSLCAKLVSSSLDGVSEV